MSILEVKDLNKSFGKKKILNNVSFSLNEGEILGFIGPNGAGKTTTIKLALGLQKIDSGSVIINGYDVKKDFVKAIEKVGAIVENPDLYMYLTGRENLKMIASMYKGITKERIDDVINIVGLGNRIDGKVSKYSLGMRQRLGIAAALLNEPNLLILDEPTNGLDPEGIKELRDLLKTLAKDGMGILISSHNLAELESFCSNVCIIQNGAVVTQGTVKEIKKRDVPVYLFEVSDASMLKDKLNDKEEILDKTHVRIVRTKKEVSSLIKELISDGVDVFEAKMLQVTLEDAFLQRTGGNVID
ncbi:MAG: ABC transporter ATP-binding protein [Bacilli bacterium]|nr:ABC transporter ATP-binding protein [Bacilli bacterium]